MKSAGNVNDVFKKKKFIVIIPNLVPISIAKKKNLKAPFNPRFGLRMVKPTQCIVKIFWSRYKMLTGGYVLRYWVQIFAKTEI